MYEVSIADQSLGYVTDTKNIQEYLYKVAHPENENIAFVDIKQQPETKLVFVNRTEEDSSDKIMSKIEENADIEYTTYAITYQGKKQAYVANKEEAEEVVSNVKKEYGEKKTKQLGILQVYSDNLEEIQSTEVKNATKQVGKAVTIEKKKEEKAKAVKLARSSIATIHGIYIQNKPLSGGMVTSRFGGRRSPGGIGSTNHKGLDIAASSGTAIKAVSGGTVTWAGYKGSLGNLVIINHGNGVQTYYGHCSRIYVSKGQKVKAGQTISAVGQTGAATGPHLHLEIHINGTAVNPQKYMYK